MEIQRHVGVRTQARRAGVGGGRGYLAGGGVAAPAAGCGWGCGVGGMRARAAYSWFEPRDVAESVQIPTPEASARSSTL